MVLAEGGMEAAGEDMAILAVHCAGWFLFYLFISKGNLTKNLHFKAKRMEVQRIDYGK